MTKVLLTGSTGFLGRNFLECSSFKERVFCINREHHPLDISFEEYARIIDENEITSIIHCGALVGRGRGSWDDYYRVNVDWTLRLAEAFAMSHVRHRSFVYISSVGVYGTMPKIIPANEDTPCNADGSYHKSKMIAEKRLKSIASTGDFSLTILRPTIMYGRYDRGFLWKLLRLSKKFALPVPFDTWIHLLDVETMVKVIYRCLSTPSVSGTFIVADRLPVNLRDLMMFLKERIPEIRILDVPNRLMQALSWLSMPFKDYADITLLCRSWYYSNNKLYSMNMKLGDTFKQLDKYVPCYR